MFPIAPFSVPFPAELYKEVYELQFPFSRVLAKMVEDPEKNIEPVLA